MSSVYRLNLWSPTTAGCMRGSVAHSGGFYHLRHHLGLYPCERGWHMSCAVACELIKKSPFRSSWPIFLTHQPTQNEGGDFCCILTPHKQFRNEKTHTHTHHQPSRRTPCQSATKVGTINLIDEQNVSQWGRAADSLCSYKSGASPLLLVSFDYLFLHQRQSSAAADMLYSPLVSNTLPWRCRRLLGMKVHYKNIHGARWRADMQMVVMQKTDNTCPGSVLLPMFSHFPPQRPSEDKDGRKICWFTHAGPAHFHSIHD